MFKMEIIEKRNTIINIVYYALLIALGIVAFKYIFPLFFPFIVGFFIAMLLKPITNYLKERINLSSNLLSSLVLSVFLILTVLLLYFSGERIIKEGSDILKKIPFLYSDVISPVAENILNRLSDFFSPFLNKKEFFDYLSSLSDSFSVKLTNFTADFVATILRSLPSLILSVVFTVISAFFFSFDYYKITNFLSKLIPVKHRPKIFQTKQLCSKTLKNMFKGYSIILIITFAELFIGLSLLRVENPLVLSMIIAFFDILPVIGSGTFLIPFAIISLLYKRIYLGIGIIILYLIITIVRNIIEPKIIGKRIGLHPIVMLISVYTGAKISGLFGIIFLPIIITVLKEIFFTKKETTEGN